MEASLRSPPKRMLPKVNIEMIIVARRKAHNVLISKEPKAQEREQDEAKDKEKEIPAPLPPFIRGAAIATVKSLVSLFIIRTDYAPRFRTTT